MRIHASFLLLVAWIALEAGSHGSPVGTELLFLFGLFGCVLLHELGHALVARKFDVPTRDITLYPFGGIAVLTRSPAPKAELFIAAAGPAVNFLLAGMCYLAYTPTQPLLEEISGEFYLLYPQSMMFRLLVANLVLAGFNLIPALPMDGGRILRSLLSIWRVRNPTLISSRVSQLISLLLIVTGLYTGDVLLLIVSSLVFMGASQEQIQSKLHRVAKQHPVTDAMISRDLLVCFTHSTTTADAARRSASSNQSVFPVLHQDHVKGVLPRSALISAGLQAKGPFGENQYVAEVMSRDFQSVNDNEPLEVLLELLQQGGKAPFIVLDHKDQSFRGIVEYERLIEFLFVNDDAADEHPDDEHSGRSGKKPNTSPEPGPKEDD